MPLVLSLTTENGQAKTITGTHPFWPDAEYIISVEYQPLAGSPVFLASADLTDFGKDLYRENRPVQSLAVLVDPANLAGVSEQYIYRTVLHECVHIGQHLLTLAHLAMSDVPSHCLGIANAWAQERARLSGHKAEPLAYAIEMLYARKTGEKGGLLLAYFNDLFPAADDAMDVVADPAYEQWQFVISEYVASALGRGGYLYWTVVALSDSSWANEQLGDLCIQEIRRAYAEMLNDTNPFAVYGTERWAEWEQYLKESSCLGK